MLWHILDAYDGKLPDDVHVCFANTGKEREETLRFVHECGSRWSVPIRWLEWRARSRGAKVTEKFAEVGYNSANRDGEVFAGLIRRKQYLPNPIMRYCTIELKIRVMRDFMVSLGYKNWTNAVGLRADEMHRVFKSIERNHSGKDRFRTIVPLANAKVRLEDVSAFWRAQPFDLGLKSYEGNCDLCFLKGRSKKVEIIREHPELVEWWDRMERTAKCSKPDGARFRKDETFAQLAASVADQPMLSLPEDDEFDAECGTWCAGEAA